MRIIVVVPHPDLEEIPKDIEGFRTPGFTPQQCQERFRDLRAHWVQVQVGDEQRGHGFPSGSSVTLMIFTGCVGTSLKVSAPTGAVPVGTAAILSTTSMPCTTWPNTA